MMCLGVGLLVHLDWDYLCFLDLCDFFPHQVKEVFCHYFFKQVFYSLILFFSFWYPYDANIIMFHLVLQLPQTIFVLFQYFFHFVVLSGCFFCLVFQLSDLIPAASTLLLISSSVFFISDIVFSISPQLLFMVSLSFLMLIQFPRSSLQFLLSSYSVFMSSYSLSSWGGLLWQHTYGTQWCSVLNLLRWMVLGFPKCHLCSLSCSNWVLVVVGSFFGGFFPPAGQESHHPPHFKCCCPGAHRTKQKNAGEKTHTCKNNP